METKYFKFVFALITIFIVSGCKKDTLTLYEAHNVHPHELEFAILDSDLFSDQRLYLDLNGESFSLYHADTIFHSGSLKSFDLSQVVGSIDVLPLTEVNRIYNPNSADDLTYYLRFWGDNADYGYSILSFGYTNDSSNVNAAIESFKVLLKKIGASVSN